MSLRCVGNQLLETAPSPLLAGASTASLSIWVRVDSGSVVADPDGVQLFGDVGGKLAVGLTASGRLQASWSANDGAADLGSSWSQPLVTGVNYHLAVTWEDGAQRYFVNGLLVHSDDQGGTLGGLGDGATSPFRLGPGLAGVDVTLDEPTLWVGYALTAEDVVSLRDRTADPSTIAPASVALQWTLAGPDGSTVAPGDADLVDRSATGLDLSPVDGAAPSYQSEVLTYSLLDNGCSAMVAPSGEGVIFAFHDAATNPTNVTGVVPTNEIQSVTVLAVPPDYATALPFTLSYGGHATPPISAMPMPALAHFQWNVPDLAPGTYDLSVNIFPGSSTSAAVTYEVFSGGVLLGTSTLNHSNPSTNPSPTPDPVLVQRGFGGGNGVPIPRYPLGRTSTTATGLSVRVSCALDSSNTHGDFDADCLWITPSGNGATLRVQPDIPPATFGFGPDGYHLDPQGYQVFGDAANMFYARGHGVGPRYLLDPAAVRSALEALPSIGAGNVSVTGDGSATSPVLVTFLGALAGVALSPMTCSLPRTSVAVDEVAKGAILPSIRINGGSPITLPRDWLYFTSRSPSMPTVHFLFPQGPPAVTYSVVRNRDNTIAGAGWGYLEINGYTGQVSYSADPAATATYRYRPVGPGTYRVSATWPADPGYSADAIYLIQDVGGVTLATVHTNQTAAPSGFSDAGVTWHDLGTFTISGLNNGLIVTQSNGGSAGMVSDAIRFERTSPDASIVIPPGARVTYSAGAGWASTTQGVAPAATDAPVSNLSGSAIYPPLPATSRMKTGFNMAPNARPYGSFLYANFARYLDGFGDYPTAIPGPTFQHLVTSCYPAFGADHKSWPNVPPGPYVLTWKGPTNLTLSCDDQQGTLVEDASRAVYPAPPGRWNRRYYAGAADAFSYGPQFNLTIHGDAPVGDGTWSCSFSALGIYPEGTDPDAPPVFRPDGVERFRGTKVIRHLDSMGAIAANPTVFADFNPPPDRLSVSRPVRILSVPIHRIEQYTGSAYRFDPGYGVPFLFTSGDGRGGVAPHGLSQFQCVTIAGYTGPPASLMDGGGATQAFGFDGLLNYIYVVDDTRFIIYDGPRNGWSMTAPIVDPAGSVVMRAGPGPALRDMIALNNQIGADFYFPVAPTATAGCLVELANYLAANLAVGLKLRVEYFNEIWNYTALSGRLTLFAGHAIYGGATNSTTQFGCEGARALWDVMKPAWVAAGRDPADFIRVMGTNHFDPSETQRILGYCRSASPPITFDELDGAPYLSNVPNGPLNNDAAEVAFSDAIDRMTAAQHLDTWEAHWVYGGHGGEIPTHLATLKAAGAPFAGVPFGAYECGPDNPMLIGGTGVNQMFLAHSIWRHPRWFGIYQHIMRAYEESGCTTWHNFQLTALDHLGQGGTGWAAYQSTAQATYVPGNPAQDAIQIGQPDRLDLIQSVIGGAIKAWAARYGAGSATPPPPPPPPTPARARRLVPRRRRRR